MTRSNGSSSARATRRWGLRWSMRCRRSRTPISGGHSTTPWRTTARGRSSSRVPSAGGARTLDVKVLPVDTGLTLLWNDATARAHAERALKRSEERLTLAAEGANDGWWEWDLRSQELYVSSRWRALLGMTGSSMDAGIARPQEWTGRVHPEDIGPLQTGARGASRRPDRLSPSRMSHASRGRHLPSVSLPRPRRERRRSPSRFASPAR